MREHEREMRATKVAVILNMIDGFKKLWILYFALHHCVFDIFLFLNVGILHIKVIMPLINIHLFVFLNKAPAVWGPLMLLIMQFESLWHIKWLYCKWFEILQKKNTPRRLLYWFYSFFHSQCGFTVVTEFGEKKKKKKKRLGRWAQVLSLHGQWSS